MFVGCDLLQSVPKAELFFDQANEEYELHLQVDSGVVAISIKELSTLHLLAEEIRASAYRLPDAGGLCDSCLNESEIPHQENNN